MQTWDDYDHACDDLDAEVDMLCGAYDPDGRPVYYHARRDTPDTELRDLAFQAVHGRAILEGERILADKTMGAPVAATGQVEHPETP